MATMGRYCKAYLVKQLRQFEQWNESNWVDSNQNLQEAGENQEVKKVLNDEDVLYLQENYVVTYGIFKDEQVVFDAVTPEWQHFCQTALQFEVPVSETVS
jgi:hypothetical protein